MGVTGHDRQGMTRRDALRNAGIAGLGLTGFEALLAQAAAASPAAGSLKDIEHVVILIQENRSFDHYFGMLPGVRGFAQKVKSHDIYYQARKSGKPIHPWHLPQACLPDISHDWGPQHKSWNGGKMNGFVSSREPASVNGPQVAPETMGYYTQKDLPFYYALANAFTICDGYHCSVIGPTDPNRLMSMSASIDPSGKHGGPLVETLTTTRSTLAGHFKWTTMPERLQAHGVSWKVYTDPAGGVLDNVLTYFKAYSNPTSTLAQRALDPTYPTDFLADLESGKLPQVSWLLTGIEQTEHPGYSTAIQGESAARQIVEAIMAKPEIWKRTALFITWDENGGFFDHVTPPTPPKGTAGEYLTVSKLPSAASGIRGPIGLGFRVPMLVVSPFSRGGLVCTDVFDHTSTLRFLETRFGVEVPNLSKWRRHATGDLTGAFNFAATPRYSKPSLPNVTTGVTQCILPPPVAVQQGAFPKQPKGTRKHPSGIVKRKTTHRR